MRAFLASTVILVVVALHAVGFGLAVALGHYGEALLLAGASALGTAIADDIWEQHCGRRTLR